MACLNELESIHPIVISLDKVPEPRAAVLKIDTEVAVKPVIRATQFVSQDIWL
jgi:hypothetical protein